MKLLISALLLCTWQLGFSQNPDLETYSGKPVDESTCVADIANLLSFTRVDSLHSEIKKPAIPNLVGHLYACKHNFTYNRNFTDRPFQLTVPAYISQVSYEFGNQKFGIVVSDDKYERTILFSYDLDDSYKKFFFSKTDESFKNAKSMELNGRKLYTFINWNGEFGGTVFCPNHLMVMYFTKSKIYETELQDAISKFKW